MKKICLGKRLRSSDGDRQFLMPLSEFERHAECIATDGSYIYLRRSLPRATASSLPALGSFCPSR